MKRLSFLIALMIALNWSGPVRSEPDISAQCLAKTFMTKGISYNDFNRVSLNDRNNYITAWLHGLHAGVGLKNKICSARMTGCLDSTTVNQRLAMLEKAAKDTPENWNEDHGMSSYILKNFVFPCIRGKIPLNK